MELKISKLTKQFGDFTAVDCLNITMTNGVYGLLGVNGAGKTTFMRIICTLLQPTSGQILCNGKDIFQMGADAQMQPFSRRRCKTAARPALLLLCNDVHSI